MGIESVEVNCFAPNCGYAKSVGVSTWRDEFPVPDVGAAFVAPGAVPASSTVDRTGFRVACRGSLRPLCALQTTNRNLGGVLQQHDAIGLGKLLACRASIFAKGSSVAAKWRSIASRTSLRRPN